MTDPTEPPRRGPAFSAEPRPGGTPRGPADRTLRRVRRFVVAFFLVMTVAVTWPGMVPFNRIRPLVLGLPLSLVWPALWIVAGCAVLFVLEWAWERAEAERAGASGGMGGPPSPGSKPQGPPGVGADGGTSTEPE